uniref:Glutathione peroxidase 3 n=1 Tax=Salvator merianae TaxID=96440 RepID=A0A8D0DUF2_SALMN
MALFCAFSVYYVSCFGELLWVHLGRLGFIYCYSCFSSLLLPGPFIVKVRNCSLEKETMGPDCIHGSVYSYGAVTVHGDEYIPFQKYAGKLLLFVNVATY